MTANKFSGFLATWLVVLLAGSGPVLATQNDAMPVEGDHANPQNHMDMDEHAAHHAALATQHYSVSNEHYAVPDVQLIDESGAPVALRDLLDSSQPVALNFIFTTCTTICPVMTATFAQMRRELGEAGAGLKMVSISIDPEYDRPGVLKAYAGLFHAGPGWTFLTGDGNDISRVMRDFDTYAGSKMNHQPVTLLKKPAETTWVRIDGLASGADLAREVKERLLN